MPIRCFVAIEIDSEIQKQLGLIQGQLRRQLCGNDAGIKWIEPHNIHLTLKFAGDVDDSQVTEICQAITDATSEFDPFDFDLEGIGCFPKEGSARVVWCGITRGQEDLCALQEAIDTFLGDAGIPMERRGYSAHLTLARIKNTNTGLAVKELVDKFDANMMFSPQSVSEVKILHSTLTKDGPIYDTIHTAELYKP